jgi:hypothetical protein
MELFTTKFKEEKNVRKPILRTAGFQWVLMTACMVLMCMISAVNAQIPVEVDPNPKTYMPVVIERDFDTTMQEDMKAKPTVMAGQV